MVKFAEADARLYKNTFVCRKCKTKIKSQYLKILAGKITCRKCKAKALRPVRKK